nr:ADP-ribosylation factor-like protein 6-interacting protein 4 isoform X3 [Zootoca vivipara]
MLLFMIFVLERLDIFEQTRTEHKSIFPPPPLKMDRNKTGVLALRWLPSPPLPPIFLVAGIPLGHSAPSRCWTDLPPFAPGADGSWSPTTLGRPSGASGKGFSGGWEPRCLACFPRRTFHGNGRGADRKSPRKLSKQLLGGPRSVSGAAEAQPSHRNPTSAKTQPPHAAPCSSRWRGPDLAGPESMMAHSQARKRFRSRSRSDSQSRRDVEEKEKKRRKSSKESQGRIRSLSPASKRGSEPPRVQMGSASSKEELPTRTIRVSNIAFLSFVPQASDGCTLPAARCVLKSAPLTIICWALTSEPHLCSRFKPY